MKKSLIFAVLFAIGVTALGAAENNISLGGRLGFSLNDGVLLYAGWSLEYDRVLFDLGDGYFSAAIEVGYGTFILVILPTYLEVRARWQPWSDMGLFADVGVGLIFGSFLISPQVGWKFDIGDDDGWYLSAAICADYLLGFESNQGVELSVNSGLIPKAGLRVGYSF